MGDPFEEELERRQRLIAEKLAELGITVQIPVQFMKIPNGPLAGQMAFTWDDTKPLQDALEADDEFAQIVAAEKASAAEEREKETRRQEEEARANLSKLAEGMLDDDDDEDDDT